MTAFTLGTFDGFHRGHQHLIHSLIERSNGLQTTALTFTNHPLEVLNPNSSPQTLITLQTKLKLLEQTGLDRVIALPFTPKFANQSAETFLKSLHSTYQLKYLLLGYDARFGHNRAGTPASIQAIAEELGITVDYLPPLTDEEGPLSSTRLRSAILKGDIPKATHLLGRPYSLPGGKLPTTLCRPPCGRYRAIIDGTPAITTLTEEGFDYPATEIILECHV